MLCYQYASLLENAHAPDDQIAAALRRAIELKPGYDDARFRLGLLESSRENYAAALEQLRAMRSCPAREPTRTGSQSPPHFSKPIRGPRPKLRQRRRSHSRRRPINGNIAALLELDTETDVTVQFARDTQGNLQMVTTRKPHGATGWNPFIELGDQIRTVTGRIRKVECTSGAITGFEIGDTTATRSRLAARSIPRADRRR